MLEHVLGAVHSGEEDAGEVLQLQQEGDLQTRQDPRGAGVAGVPFSQGVQGSVSRDDCRFCDPCPEPSSTSRNLDSANSLELVRDQRPLEPRLETLSEGRAPLSRGARDAGSRGRAPLPPRGRRPGPRGRRPLLFNINILTPTSETLHKAF